MASPLAGFKLPSQSGSTGGGSASRFASLDIEGLRSQLAARTTQAKPKPIDPNMLGDTKALNAALKGGQITQQQFADRYNTLNNKAPTSPYNAKNTFSALGSALNQVVVKPAVALPKSAYDIGRGAAASVTGNKKALVNANKAKATDEPQALAPVARPLIQVARTIEHPGTANTFTPKSDSAKRVFGDAPVQNIAAGYQSTAKTHGKLAAALYAAGQVGQDVSAIGGLKAVGDTAGSSIMKTLGTGDAKTALQLAQQRRLLQAGKTSNVADTSKKLAGTAIQESKTLRVPVVRQAESQAGQRALGALSKAAVTESKTQRVPVTGKTTAEGVPVRTPIHAGIKQVSTATKIGVRTPVQMTDQQFNKEFNQLSKSYKQSTETLQKNAGRTHPDILQAQQHAIETGHQKQLENLLDRYSNPDLSKPVAPKQISSSTSAAGKNTGGVIKPPKPRTLAAAITKAQDNGTGVPAPRARSAFDRLAKQSAESQKAAETAGKQMTAVEAPQSSVSTKAVESTAPTTKVLQTAPEKPTTPRTVAGSEKTSGSATRTQQEAVQSGMKSEAQTTGATYTTVSHADEAAKAVKLVNENPEKAKQIAMGGRGDNASHESAVYHAYKNAAIEKAQKTGDWGEVTELANSPRHTGVSEAAQKLGAEGYNVNPHDPVSIMNDVSKTRTEALGKNARTVPQEAKVIAHDVQKSLPKVSREDWHSFVDSLKC